jgi:hypothetical protein
MTSFTRSNGHGHYSSTPNATRMGTRSHTWVESLQTKERFCITTRFRGQNNLTFCAQDLLRDDESHRMAVCSISFLELSLCVLLVDFFFMPIGNKTPNYKKKNY